MARPLQVLFAAIFTITLLAGLGAAPAADLYDPLQVSTEKMPAPLDLMVNDSHRDRQIPVLIYLPREKEAQPVVLFSHGLGGSRKGSAYLGQHWSERGYVAVFLQHPGSDDSIWKDAP